MSLVTDVTLRDGRLVQLRPARPEDEEDLLALDHDVVEAGRGIVRAPGEGGTDVEGVRKRIAELGPADPERGVLLVARSRDDSALLGESTLRRFRAGLLHHGAMLAVQVHPDAQGIGLGRALMERLLWWATECPKGPAPGLCRLELAVRSDNHRAIGLYESLGFELEAVRRGCVRELDGTFVDDCIMVRWEGPERPE